MPVYDGARYLTAAIDSLLHQTFQDFEVVVVDDGSTDATPEILRGYGRRLRVLRQAHAGIVLALNAALERARGEFVARMDADDVAEPSRLERQVDFLRRHPEVGVLGTALRFVDDRERSLGISRVVADDLSIRWMCLLACPFMHPSVMLRRSVLAEHRLSYAETARAAEDYELWVRMLRCTQGANLRAPLVRHRLHRGSLSARTEDSVVTYHHAIARYAIEAFLPTFAIESDDLRQLIWLAFRIGAPSPDVDARRVRLAETYLDMFSAFACAHVGHPRISEVRREVALRAMRILSGAALRPRSWFTLRRLFEVDPFWMGHLVAAVPRMLAAQLRNRALRGLRTQAPTWEGTDGSP
jgi:glycosyltransferase involved in cell wall biosynthesis